MVQFFLNIDFHASVSSCIFSVFVIVSYVFVFLSGCFCKKPCMHLEGSAVKFDSEIICDISVIE